MLNLTTPRSRLAQAGLLTLITLLAPLARGADHYVRAGASGNGADWANALPQLPPALTRGDTYWVAAGQYPAYTFTAAEGGGTSSTAPMTTPDNGGSNNTAPKTTADNGGSSSTAPKTSADSGGTTITVKKATAEAHGNGAGWNEAYANGPAVWGPITCSASGIVFDGVTGKGKEGHGFEIFDPSGEKSLWEFQNAPQNVTISHVNMHFQDRKSAKGDAIYGNTPCKNITVSHCYIHDIGRCPVLMREWENLVLEHSWIARNHSTPADHAEGISTHGGGGHIIRYNTWEDIEGTAIIVNLAKPSRDWQIYGNVFFQNPGSDCTGVGHGIVGDNFSDSGINGLKYYNNSAYNITGVCSGLRFWGSGASNIVASNNVWANCKELGFNGVAHDNNSYYSCAMTYQFQSGAGKSESQVAGDPYVNAASGDLHLKSATTPGVKLEAPWNVDGDDTARGSDGVWDRGAFEFGGTKVAGADGKSTSTGAMSPSSDSSGKPGSGSDGKSSGDSAGAKAASMHKKGKKGSGSGKGSGLFKGVRVSSDESAVSVSTESSADETSYNASSAAVAPASTTTPATPSASATAAATPVKSTPNATPQVLYQAMPAAQPAAGSTQQGQGSAMAQQGQAAPASGADATSSSRNRGGGHASRKSSRRSSGSSADPKAPAAAHDEQTGGPTGYMSAALASPSSAAATYSIPEVQDEAAPTSGSATASVTSVNAAGPSAAAAPAAKQALPTSATQTAAAATSATTATNPNQGLVVALNFDRVSGGYVEDASGHGNKGAVQGAAWTPSGKFGGCLIFDGAQDRVTINDSPSLAMKDGLTIEAWIHPVNTMAGWRSVVMKERPQGADYYLYANTEYNQPGASVFVKNEVLQIGGAKPALNVWTHIAATYDGQRQRLYLNGMLVAERRQSGPIQPGAGALRIGGNAIWGEGFTGRIDELRIYNRALKLSEVLRDMATPVR